jgi:hypothetical protein
MHLLCDRNCTMKKKGLLGCSTTNILLSLYLLIIMFLHILFTCLILLQIEAKKLPNGLFGLKAFTFFKKKKKKKSTKRKKNYPNTQLTETALFYNFTKCLKCDFQNRDFKMLILKSLFLKTLVFKQLPQTDP